MHALPPVVDRVMSCFALGLGFPEDFFKEVRSRILRPPLGKLPIACVRN